MPWLAITSCSCITAFCAYSAFSLTKACFQNAGCSPEFHLECGDSDHRGGRAGHNPLRTLIGARNKSDRHGVYKSAITLPIAAVKGNRTASNMNEVDRTSIVPRLPSVWITVMLFVCGYAHSSRLIAQSPADTNEVRLPEFEVVSIRGHEQGYWPTFERKEFTSNGFTWLNAQPQAIIVYAYDLRDPKLGPELIPGAPKWIRSEWYDIRATLSGSDIMILSRLSPQQRDSYRRRLLKSLLANRFKLKAHLVSRESLTYELLVAKGGLKNLKEASPGEDPHVDWVDAGYGQYHGVPLDALVMLLKMHENCPVVDKTGLTGRYDFELKWERTPETMPLPGASSVPSPPSGDTSRPSLFTALREQLGLRLVPLKAPIESIVIDHIEKPSPN
jgi:uncharacterized protein (TIGR03435 family)